MPDFELARDVCAQFFRPAPVRVAPVTGGFQHRLLRLDFPSGEALAMKILAPRSTRTEADISKFERAETLASLAAQNGVPALVALQQPGGTFVGRLEDAYFLLYPWANGEVLPPTAVSPDRARKMGGFLARIHALQARFPEQSAPLPEAFRGGHFEELLRRAAKQNASWTPRLTEAVDELERLNARACDAQIGLREGWVTGHLDFDQKNVLWHRDEPLILDWEQAKPISPALEAMGAGLLWAGQSAGEASKATFLAWLAGYRTHFELRLEALELASDGVLGKWTIWLEFNLQRLLDRQLEESEREIAFDAGMHALGTTLQLGRDGAKYRAWCHEAFDSD